MIVIVFYTLIGLYLLISSVYFVHVWSSCIGLIKGGIAVQKSGNCAYCNPDHVTVLVPSVRFCFEDVRVDHLCIYVDIILKHFVLADSTFVKIVTDFDLIVVTV